jgi:hypothetical protein
VAQKKLFIIIAALTFLFCLFVGFDVFPFLRGPAPYPPEWQWPYFFVNTFSKIFLPVVVIFLFTGLFLWEEKTHFFSKKHPIILLILLILLAFLLQLSLLYFSRSGVSVLIHRIINPELNGYFTASLSIHSVTDFLANYNELMLQFVYHAKAHPPGAILLFYYLKLLLAPFTFFIQFVNQLQPNHADVLKTWSELLPIDKATAIFSAFFIPLLSTISLIPLYFSAKLLYGVRVAIRSAFLFFFIPTLLFFIPINDAFLHLFAITSFVFLLIGLKNDSFQAYLLSGISLFLGVFFNLSLLPLLILLFIFALLFLYQQKKKTFKHYLRGGAFFSLGFFVPALLLNSFFHFNFLQVIQTIMKHVPDIHTRSYPLWLYFNIHDFLIFCGIPITIILFLLIKQTFVALFKKQWKKIDLVFLALFLMIVILNFSGSVRGETGRLWSPYIPFVTLATTMFLTDKLKFSSKLFAGFLLLQALQILIMQEFWVMLW